MTRSLVVGIIVTIVVLGPASIVFWLSRVDNHHQAVVNEYECDRDVCESDFDGDGLSGTLMVDHAAPFAEHDSWWVVVDSGEELLRLPRRDIDNSLRTHAALYRLSGTTRIIIYDHVNKKTPVNAVYAYDGHRMVEVGPTEKDREILKAIGSLDDSGSFGTWVLFRVFWKPALVCYYLLLVVIGWIALRKQLRPVKES
jgi:hypothetical protein